MGLPRSRTTESRRKERHLHVPINQIAKHISFSIDNLNRIGRGSMYKLRAVEYLSLANIKMFGDNAYIDGKLRMRRGPLGLLQKSVLVRVSLS